jgi:hypothetical protein
VTLPHPRHAEDAHFGDEWAAFAHANGVMCDWL